MPKSVYLTSNKEYFTPYHKSSFFVSRLKISDFVKCVPFLFGYFVKLNNFNKES